MPLLDSAACARIPYTYKGICDWAIVCENPTYRERIRSQVIIYKDLLTSQNRQFTPIIIHLQGFVKNVNIHVLGDWDRSVSVFV